MSIDSLNFDKIWKDLDQGKVKNFVKHLHHFLPDDWIQTREVVEEIWLKWREEYYQIRFSAESYPPAGTFTPKQETFAKIYKKYLEVIHEKNSRSQILKSVNQIAV